MGSEKIFLCVLLTLAQLETQDGDRVQRVFRDSPIDQLHPQSRHHPLQDKRQDRIVQPQVPA